jgi:hypothetical protein
MGQRGVSGRAIVKDNATDGLGRNAGAIGAKDKFDKLIHVRVGIIIVNLVEPNRVLIGDLFFCRNVGVAVFAC